MSVEMSEHRPTTVLKCDVFDDIWEGSTGVTPRAVAEDAWSSIQSWGKAGYRPVISVFMEGDPTEHVVDLSEEPERSEDDPHPIIERVTHVRCGITFTDPFTIDVMNEVDSACPNCSAGEPAFPPDIAYGALVWEHRDGTLWETYSKSDGEMIRHQRVFTHCTIYKSWTNGPEWWVRPEPNTGDLDDDHTVGFDHYWQARAAVGNVWQIITEIAPAGPDSVTYRSRRNPIYQLTQRGAQF